ncbi:MFS transporter [Subtercola lobariae]|uniref:MFS transporter n=1 Tax=Subtercola lobariae TaxID=1588641 RepID=A0A917BD79_9MICO|nr:MFS transporter [Subtercola lobariae]GGF37289.1 MFS transporter [Subtercola lobariae]
MTTARIRFVGSYTDILRLPGARSFVVAGWLGRILRSTSGIATILLVAGQTGSFALAGAVSGAIVLGIAAGGPVWSRAVDARGQRLVVPFSLGATVLAAAALVGVVVGGAHTPTWFVAAFALGAASIDMGSLVRARWRSMLSSPTSRHTSLSLEAVSDELVFVVGPPVVTVIAASVGTVAGFATGVVVATVGGAWLWSQRATTPPVVALLPASAGGPARRRRFRLPAGVAGLLPVYVGVGVVFASIDVAAVGVARGAGQTWLAGVILAVFAVGSVVAGFAFGPLSARWAASRRVLVSTIAYAVVVPSLLLFQSPAVLASMIFVAGLVTAPVLISGTSLIASRVDGSRLTEALTWPSIGLSIGVTLGGALTGIAIDDGTAFSAFIVSACAAVAVGVFGVTRSVLDRRAEHPQPSAPVTATSSP